MKNTSFAGFLRSVGLGIFLALFVFSWNCTSLRAQELSLGNPSNQSGANLPNIATEAKGAVVIFASPLRHGEAANILLESDPKRIAFSWFKGASSILVIDLGREYKIRSIRLKLENYSKARAYVFKNRPRTISTWFQYVQDHLPNTILSPYPQDALMAGLEGRYLVVVFDQDPGYLSNLYVTGLSHGQKDDELVGARGGPFGGMAGAAGTAGGESPIPVNQFTPPPASP